MKPVTVVEVLVTYISIGWALVLFTNSNTFEQSQNFITMQSIVKHEWVVGIICLLLGLIKILGMVLRNIRLRWLGLILSAILWIIVSATFLLSPNQFDFNTGFIVYSGVAVMCLITSKEVLLHDRAE